MKGRMEVKMGRTTGEKKSPTLEENFSALEQIIEQMEKPDISLEDSFRYYKEGLTLVKNCTESIDKIEKEIKVLEADDD